MRNLYQGAVPLLVCHVSKLWMRNNDNCKTQKKTKWNYQTPNSSVFTKTEQNNKKINVFFFKPTCNSTASNKNKRLKDINWNSEMWNVVSFLCCSCNHVLICFLQHVNSANPIGRFQIWNAVCKPLRVCIMISGGGACIIIRVLHGKWCVCIIIRLSTCNLVRKLSFCAP